MKDPIFYDIGPLAYDQALRLQTSFWAQTKDDGVSRILVLEHPLCVTRGKNAEISYDEESRLREKSIPVFDTDRGGKLTLHEPGQLVVYPIMNIGSLGVKRFVGLLEDVMISMCKAYGVSAQRHADHDGGIWVEAHSGLAKIGFIGLRIKDRVSYHGFSLNISNDMAPFSEIIPCGIPRCPLTRISDLNPTVDSQTQIFTTLCTAFADTFGYEVFRIDPFQGP